MGKRFQAEQRKRVHLLYNRANKDYNMLIIQVKL